MLQFGSRGAPPNALKAACRRKMRLLSGLRIMPASIDSEKNQDAKAIVNTIGASLLSRNITFARIEYAEDVNTCFVFISTRNVSAVDISPLEQVAKEVSAELKAVIDSDKDQLCFLFVYKFAD